MDLQILTADGGSGSGAPSSGLDQFGAAKAKLDELFIYWLSLPDTTVTVNSLLADIKAGKQVAVPSGSLTSTLLAKQTSGGGPGSPASPLRSKNSPPPRSPVGGPRSPSGAQPPHFTFDEGTSSPTSAGKDPRAPARLDFTGAEGTEAATSPGFSGGQGGAGAGAGASSSLPPPPASPVRTTGTDSASGSSGAKVATPPPVNNVAGAKADVPTFFVKGQGGRGRGRPIPTEKLEQKLDLIVEVFRAAKAARPANVASTPAAMDGVPADTLQESCQSVTLPLADLDTALRVDQFPAVAKTLCGFPSFFAAPLFRRIKKLYKLGDGEPAKDGQEGKETAGDSKAGDAAEEPDIEDEDKGEVPLRVFLQYWRDEMEPYDHVSRFFRLTKQPDARAIVKSDFLPLMEELLAFHPGLAFLEGTPEFQEKYARTVIARIFYMLDPLNFGSISERSLRRSNLIQAFLHVDMEEDINLVNEYFSYEHFYVLYCKFWELDTDHDFLLSREDLTPLGNHSLTTAILDRVFSQAGRPFECKEPNKMGYEDFVCFLMSEEDKTHPVSLAYWFRLIDLDSDGVIRTNEMRHFYKEQMQRMDDMNCEVVPFEDVLCQMSDLLTPDVEGEFRLTDFMKPDRIRLTGVFFSILSNLNKFTAFEQRDPFVVKQQQEPGFTAWDRYAQIEYARLAMEEDAHDEEEVQLDSLQGSADVVGAWGDDDGGPMNVTGGGTAESPF